MSEHFINYKKEIGDRFRIFRQLVLKSRAEFANEASLPEDYIAQIEWGTVIPGLLSIEYYYKEYGLNLTWLVSGDGNIFYKKGPRTPHHAFQIDSKWDYRDAEFQEYLAIVKQMNVSELKSGLNKVMENIKNEYQPYFDYYAQLELSGSEQRYNGMQEMKKINQFNRMEVTNG